MKKLFIFALFINITTLIGGCNNTRYECTSTLIWEDEDGKSRGRGFEIKSTSYSETMNAALEETLGDLKTKYPKATTEDIYIMCSGGDEEGYHGDTKPCVKDGFGNVKCHRSVKANQKPEKKSGTTKPGAKSKAKQKRITFGCRARVETGNVSRRSIYHNSKAIKHDIAVAEVRNIYKKKYPDAHNFESNCWPCTLPRLDEYGQIVCEQPTRSTK